MVARALLMLLIMMLGLLNLADLAHAAPVLLPDVPTSTTLAQLVPDVAPCANVANGWQFALALVDKLQPTLNLLVGAIFLQGTQRQPRA